MHSPSIETAAQHTSPEAMTVWYRLVEAAAPLPVASWESDVVGQRMQAQEMAAQGSRDGPSAIARDGLHILQHISVAPASIVDIGCGSGHWSRILAMAAHPLSTWRYTGVEINAQRMEICRRLHPGVNFHEGRGEALPFANGGFDVALSSGVLQYVNRWRAALCDAARVARAYVAVLRLPIIKYRPTAQCLQLARTGAGEEVHHFWMFQREEFEEAAREAGLRITARDYTDECIRVEGLDERLFWLNYVLEHPRH